MANNINIDTSFSDMPERAILVGLVTPAQDEKKAAEYLAELAFLADTAGAEAVKTFTQKVDYPNPRTFVGKGKLEEIKKYIEEDGDISMAIFDDDLSTKQVVNIERELGVKILDRTTLILDIFARRAQRCSIYIPVPPHTITLRPRASMSSMAAEAPRMYSKRL